jgi:hypothetical protein
MLNSFFDDFFFDPFFFEITPSAYADVGAY